MRTLTRQSKDRQPTAPRGYTLLELSVVAGVLSLLIILGTSAFKYARPSKLAIQELKSALDRARSEAIRYKTDTYVAFTDSLPNLEGSSLTYS